MPTYEDPDMQIQTYALDGAEEDRVRPRPSTIGGGTGGEEGNDL